ncbi:endonuclease/exonuclease/phosphatase family protein [Aggregatibacter sp. oral taxon 458 str. W10330]|uniref:endonuclease/exonuclease/phosphatase family protein n=1 Tax=Aggregatibacter sp. oral taxon 458 TaxID=712148 RepID=UPI00039794E3|nr:endonuclease/exonuclease/phosphatase family protein [Aggregatibacter sp. oral taxon 458]ERH27983.1 endonuclease/exonuclease/phosphatase family protein [Aggregatibacter sp. oral taxon 458 str. W10330]
MMFKKHAFKFITFLVFLIAAITGYLFYSLTIFSPVNIHFSTMPNLTYHPIKKQDELICYQADQAPREITQKTFRLLVWNLHKGQDAGWQEALERFAQGRDILLLQEVLNTQELAAQYSSRFPTALYASAFAYLQQQSGVEILSQFAPHFYCAGSKSEPWIRIPKVGAAMSLPLSNGQALLLVNVHLINFEINPTTYEAQLHTLMQLVSQHQGPLVLSGDFNSWNGYRAQIIRKVINEFGLEEVSFEQDHRLRFLGNPLDHVFVRGLNVLNATTEPTESSDHAPLLLEVELAD